MTTQVYSPYHDYFNRLDYSNYDNYYNISDNIENQTNRNINENLFEDEIDFHNIDIRLNFDEVVNVDEDEDEDLILTRLKPIELDRLTDIIANEDCCAFCLESYSFGDEGNVCGIRCNHCFHTNCISNWLMTGHQTCPMCRIII